MILAIRLLNPVRNIVSILIEYKNHFLLDRVSAVFRQIQVSNGVNIGICLVIVSWLLIIVHKQADAAAIINRPLAIGLNSGFTPLETQIYDL